MTPSRSCSSRSVTRGGAALVATVFLLLAAPPFAGGASEYETPPVLKANELVSADLLKGKGFRVDEKVPTDGVMGNYIIRADAATFRDDAGTYGVRGRELLEIRVREMPAIATLIDASKTAAFAKGMGAAAVRPLEAAGSIALNPVDTVAGLPGGVGRLFDRVEAGAVRLADTADEGGKSDLERTGDVAASAGKITRDTLGYEQERRQLAKKLNVDPYTSNPILAKKLDDVAWASFAGRLTVNMAMSVAVPGSILITGIRSMDDMVWDTPRGDLIVRVETKLEDLKVPRPQIAVFTHNLALPLSLQVAVVENLGRLGNMRGRRDVVTLLAAATTESQARFIVTSLRMLADYHERQKPLTAIAAPGPLVGRDRDSALILPAPVDYLTWTERMAAFATSPDFLAVSNRTVWLAGKTSPRAKKELAANGWAIRGPGE